MHHQTGTDWHSGNNSGEGPYKFDRRRSERWEEEGQATAFVLGGEMFGTIFELKTFDCSNGGVGAECQQAINPGTVVSVGFDNPAHGARRAVVVGCYPNGSGYRIGIRYEGRLAA